MHPRKTKKLATSKQMLKSSTAYYVIIIDKKTGQEIYKATCEDNYTAQRVRLASFYLCRKLKRDVTTRNVSVDQYKKDFEIDIKKIEEKRKELEIALIAKRKEALKELLEITDEMNAIDSKLLKFNPKAKVDKINVKKELALKVEVKK